MNPIYVPQTPQIMMMQPQNVLNDQSCILSAINHLNEKVRKLEEALQMLLESSITNVNEAMLVRDAVINEADLRSSSLALSKKQVKALCVKDRKKSKPKTKKKVVRYKIKSQKGGKNDPVKGSYEDSDEDSDEEIEEDEDEIEEDEKDEEIEEDEDEEIEEDEDEEDEEMEEDEKDEDEEDEEMEEDEKDEEEQGASPV